MKVDIIQTGSLGNATVLTDADNNQLLIDCGTKYEAIVPHLGMLYKLSLIITHQHGDHVACADKFSFLGIPSCAPLEVCKNIPFGSTVAEHGKVVALGSAWKVLPISVPHGDCECFAYIIVSTVEHKKIFWATDLQKMPLIADSDDWSLIAAECNYDEEAVAEATAKGTLQNLGFRNHHSLQSLSEWLGYRRHKPRRLCAIHLSNSGLIQPDAIRQTLVPQCQELIIGKKNTVFNV